MKVRAVICAACLALFLSAGANAQTSYFSPQIIRKGRDFSFPVFHRALNGEVETKINRLLQLSELMKIAKDPSPLIFSQVLVDDGTIYGGKTSMTAAIYSNSSDILSVGFDESSCGMTCAYWHKYHNFNPGNGDRIELKDLIDKTVYGSFRDFVYSKRARSYRSEVGRKVPLGDRQDLLDEIESLKDSDLSDFYILHGSLIIDGENFLPKNNKFFGLNMKVRFGRNEIKNFLNAYGRAVFGLSNDETSKFHSTSLPQLFEGKVDGKWPFALVLDVAGDEKTALGVYAYLRHGVGIDLQGQVDKTGKIVLTERVLVKANPDARWLHDGEYDQNATIAGALSDDIFEGTWTSLDKLTTLPFIAKRR